MSSKNPVLDSVKESIRKNPGTTVLTLLCIAGSVIAALLPPLVLERGVNLIAAGKPIPLSLAIIYLALIVAADMFESAQGAAIMIFGQRLTHGIRSKLCAKLNRLPAGYFTSHDSGRTASVFVNDADTIDTLYSDGIVGMIADSFKIISILVIIFTRSLGLGLLLLVVTPFLFYLTRRFQRATLSAQRDNRTAIAKVNNHIPETIRNIRMIHVFEKETYMEDKYDEYISESYDAVNRSNLYDSIYSPIILITQALVVAVMMAGAAQGSSIQKLFGLSVGSAVAVIAYVGKIFSPLESIGMEIQNIQSAMAGISHINEFLREEEIASPEKIPDSEIAVKFAKAVSSDKEPSPVVCFRNVTFGYKAGEPVLKNFSCSIQGGESVTFIGRTGAGKSTVFRLLTGLYRPQAGEVFVNGRDPASITEPERRKLFGLVEQKFTPVPGTVRDQITLYDPDITDEMVQTAISVVGLDKMEDASKETVHINPDCPMEEQKFSRGELQLLSIARAIVTDPEILLLDEITANLDSTTETKVLEALKRACANRTVLSVSHRYQTEGNAERLIRVGD